MHFKYDKPNITGRLDKPEEPPDACRLYGSLVLNKVAGNLHITAGKSMTIPQGHIHISAFITPTIYNFTHRIHHLSFGDSSVGIIHPLDGDEKITKESLYFSSMNHTTFFKIYSLITLYNKITEILTT